MTGAHRRPVIRFVGVYDADHTVLGELAYFVRARTGSGHCGLCDITHGLVREKAAWRACRADLGVPFDTFHRDDRPADVRAASSGEAPVVLAEVAGPDGGELVVLLRPPDLHRCAGSIEAMLTALGGAAVRLGLDWAPGSPPGPAGPASG